MSVYLAPTRARCGSIPAVVPSAMLAECYMVRTSVVDTLRSSSIRCRDKRFDVDVPRLFGFCQFRRFSCFAMFTYLEANLATCDCVFYSIT